ncbi:hypothetical protein ACLNGM_10030 [Aureimonas phyllosphaerae]|uniref:hypothetical protein n=1 Tax=Aureimonas phyllosphaerae TaxID=1166078 RepID=UPI003A5B9D9D
MGKTMFALRWAFTTGLRDAIGLTGAGSIVYGVHLMHAPSAFLVGGAMMVSVAVAAARKSA